MLQIIIQKIVLFLREKNRWWMPVITGLLYSLSQPPFNHEFNPLFFAFPLLSFIVLIPLFSFAIEPSFKKALFHCGLFVFCASLSQYYWIGFVTAEGLWHLILIGTVLISLYMGLFYFIAAILFRFIIFRFPRLYLLAVPAIWVIADYSRTLGEIPFPWGFLGYSLTPFTPLIQISSVTGVWGLTFLVVLGNLLIWELLRCYNRNEMIVQKWIHITIFCVFLGLISIWGCFRTVKSPAGENVTVALLQPNLDQLNWGTHSLDSALVITDTLVFNAAQKKPDLIIAPESALLCFLARRPEYLQEVKGWVDSIKTPLLLGALHWDKAPDHSYYDFFVYNSAFLFKPGIDKPINYNKIKLVPFSEVLPFEGLFPILSRVNLGEADFQKGKEQTVFSIGKNIRAAPFICYEVIFPSFVQKRIKQGANLITTITNDGWFGKTAAPFQHAAMARMRAVETGRPLVRSANTGISMVVDRFGRVLQQTSIYKRDMLTGSVSLDTSDTIYLKWGDWFVYVCAVISIGILLATVVFMVKRNGAGRGNK